MNKQKFFITGTDTNVGKTFITVELLKAFAAKELRTLALKPVAAGAELTVDGLKNEDALLLQQHATINLAYEQVNPVVMQAAIAPHIAQKREGKKASLKQLSGFVAGAMLTPHDICLVEGVGGWFVPLNDSSMLSDLAVDKKFPVILVVGVKLGCINHAILTAKAIKQSGGDLVGWIGNESSAASDEFTDIMQTLSRFINAPCLGYARYQTSREQQDWQCDIDIEALLSHS